jgi:uncharacterized protein YciI
MHLNQLNIVFARLNLRINDAQSSHEAHLEDHKDFLKHIQYSGTYSARQFTFVGFLK